MSGAVPAPVAGALGVPPCVTVPHNRWDLLPLPASPPAVSVVVPWFRQQAQLERLLAGVELQRGACIREVVVADDGSPEPPVVPTGYAGPPVVVVRQPDLGVRPGAARNLGVRSATGDVLVFLDADMVPSPTYVAAVAALPAVAPEVLVVGTRQHWDLEGWSGSAVRSWLSGGRRPPRLEDPAWLAEGYARSRHLLDLDARSYQYVIGAVMTMHRSLFAELGGFDDGIDAYGAEDWDLAHRAQNAGALIAHVDGIAHHDGPDWRARVGPDGVKNEERAHLVARIPSRTDPVLGSPPHLRVALRAAGATEAACVACVGSVLAAGGLSTHVDVLDPEGPCPSVLAADPRVRWGGPDPVSAPDPSAATAVVEVDLGAPVLVGPTLLDEVCDLLVPGGPGRLRVLDAEGELVVAREVRARRRVERWAGPPDAPGWAELFGAAVEWRAEAVGVRRTGDAPDLATVFPR